MLDSHLHEAATGGFRWNAIRARRRRDRQRAYSADSRCEAVVAAGWSLRTTRPSDVQAMGTRRRKKRIRGWEEELPRNKLEFKFRDFR